MREKHEMWDKQERRRVMGGKGGIIEERKRLRKLEGKVEQGLERREDLGKLCEREENRFCLIYNITSNITLVLNAIYQEQMCWFCQPQTWHDSSTQ